MTNKKEVKTELKKFYKIKSKNNAVAILKITNKDNLKVILEGLKTIPVDFVIETNDEFENQNNLIFTKNIKKDLLNGFDFIVVDNEVEGLNEYFSFGIVPIIPKNTHLSSILKEFDPMQNIGNSYFYEDNNMWSMFYSIVRYLENYKFPYDNRNLVKNVICM